MDIYQKYENLRRKSLRQGYANQRLEALANENWERCKSQLLRTWVTRGMMACMWGSKYGFDMYMARNPNSRLSACSMAEWTRRWQRAEAKCIQMIFRYR